VKGCVAALLVALAGCGSSPPAPAIAPPPAASAAPASPVTPAAAASGLPTSVDEAMGRVQTLIANPDDGVAMQATFSPTFLTSIPADKMKGLGACKDRSVVQVKSDTTALVRVQCERGALNVTIVVNPAPPHLVEEILFKPAS
jgi:hypothetical protein